jgi:hypothetical protein
MSFHFQPEADSSDEEGQVDLAAWQGAAKPKPESPAQRAPEGPFQGQTDEDNEEDIANGTNAGALDDPEDADNPEEQADEDEDAGEEADDNDSDAIEIRDSRSASSKASNKRQSNVRQSNISTGFTSMNEPVEVSSRDSSEDELASTPTLQTQRRIVPVIPRGEVDSNERAEFEDFTTGGDVVRRVLKETNVHGREVLYKVEFEDLHVDEVRFAIGFAFYSRCCCFMHCLNLYASTCHFLPRLASFARSHVGHMTCCCLFWSYHMAI